MDQKDSKTEIYREVFINCPDGGDVLMDILNENNYFSEDASIIRPEQIAFCNKLLNNIGVFKPEQMRISIGKMLESVK